MDEAVFRQQVVELLTGGHAHVPVLKALQGLDPLLRGKRPAEGIHSVWEELEHMRIAQEDILRYTLDPGWRSPDWPGGYWPPEGEPTEAAWSGSLTRFAADLDEVCAMVKDRSRELTARIPHGEGRTYLRQAFLVADHNAYHLGQIVQTRKRLGAWPA
jgi:uncharacterized damage-inducible protein DinB